MNKENVEIDEYGLPGMIIYEDGYVVDYSLFTERDKQWLALIRTGRDKDKEAQAKWVRKIFGKI